MINGANPQCQQQSLHQDAPESPDPAVAEKYDCTGQQSLVIELTVIVKIFKNSMNGIKSETRGL